jgi:ribonuclease-3
LLNFFNQKSKDSEEKNRLTKSIVSITGIKPKNILLYQQALRHSSAAKEIKEGIKDSNERLEFLGDAVLGLIVAEYLFKIYPFKDEGFLTQMRSRIVNRNKLNQIALKIGLNELVSYELKGARAGSIFGDAFEALIGAITLDKGIETARKYIIERILSLHINISEIENTDTDFKSKLIKWGQQSKKKIEFFLEHESGPSHNKNFTIRVLIDGEPSKSFQHNSKRRAEQSAAELTLKSLGIDSDI